MKKQKTKQKTLPSFISRHHTIRKTIKAGALGAISALVIVVQTGEFHLEAAFFAACVGFLSGVDNYLSHNVKSYPNYKENKNKT